MARSEHSLFSLFREIFLKWPHPPFTSGLVLSCSPNHHSPDFTGLTHALFGFGTAAVEVRGRSPRQAVINRAQILDSNHGVKKPAFLVPFQLPSPVLSGGTARTRSLCCVCYWASAQLVKSGRLPVLQDL